MLMFQHQRRSDILPYVLSYDSFDSAVSGAILLLRPSVCPSLRKAKRFLSPNSCHRCSFPEVVMPPARLDSLTFAVEERNLS
jgi:hypothetical protein